MVAALKPRKIGIEEDFRALQIPIYIGDSKGRSGRLRFVINVLRRERPEIAHSVLYESNVLLRLARHAVSDIQVVQSLVGTPYLGYKDLPGVMGTLKAKMVKMLDRATSYLGPVHYHVVSETVLDHYRPILLMREDHTHIVYRGRVAYGDPGPRDFPKDKLFTLVSVGRQDVLKNQQTAVEAVGILKVKYGIRNVELRVYGREGSETGEIKRLITKYGLEERVILEGFCNSMQAAYRDAHAFIFPSLSEGAAGAMLEAMSSRLPIICSDIPVLHELIGSREGALFFTMQDADDAARCIKEVMDSPDRYRKLSDYSYRRYRDSFTEEASLQNFYNMYERILGNAV